MSEEINESINTPPNVLSVNTNKQQDIMESDHATTNMVKLAIFLLETYLMKQVLGKLDVITMSKENNKFERFIYALNNSLIFTKYNLVMKIQV